MECIHQWHIGHCADAGRSHRRHSGCGGGGTFSKMIILFICSLIILIRKISIGWWVPVFFSENRLTWPRSSFWFIAFYFADGDVFIDFVLHLLTLSERKSFTSVCSKVTMCQQHREIRVSRHQIVGHVRPGYTCPVVLHTPRSTLLYFQGLGLSVIIWYCHVTPITGCDTYTYL